jgi:2-keto-4-pentenoate hydratase
MADVRRAADAIWQLARQGVHYPPAWRGKLTVEEGYRVQLEHLVRHVRGGERHAGWKVGLTAPAIRAQVGYHRPVFGFLLESGAHPSGSRFRVADLITPLLEPELCLTVDRTLRGPGITPAQARQTVSAAAPAFELVERRGSFSDDPPLSMADNVQQKGFITGAELHPLPPALALRTVTVEVFLNGQSVERASGREVFGDPAASLAWLANALAPFGLAVEPGMRIMSGSFTRQVPARPGDRIEARFDPIGTVAALFE